MNPHRLKAYGYLLATAVIWGIAGPVIKLTLKEMSAETFVFYRFFLSTIAILPFIIKSGLRLPVKRPRILSTLIFCAFLNSTAGIGLLFWGTSLTNLLSMSLISIFGPLMLITFGFIFMHDHLTKQEKAGTIVAFIGAAVLVFSPLVVKNQGQSEFLGNILVLLSVVAVAWAGLLIKKLLRDGVTPVVIANTTFIVGFLTIFPIVLIKNGVAATIESVIHLPLVYQAGVIYMAFISGNLAYFLYNLGQKTIEVSEAAPFSYLYPVISAFFAVFLLGDRLTTPVVIGSVVIFVGVFLAEWKRRRYNSSS